MSKKILVVFLILLCAMSAFCGGGKEKKENVVNNTTDTSSEVTAITTSSSSAADVELVSKVSITKRALEDKVKMYTDAGIQVDAKDVLEDMINSELFNQLMIKENIDVDAAFTNYVVNAASYYASQYGVTFEAPEDIDNFFASLGTTTLAFADSLRGDFQNAIISQYVTEKYADDFANIPAVTDEDISAFYDSNKDMLANSEKVKIAHVFFAVTDPANDSSVKSTAESVAKQLKNGTLTFEKAVSTYSQDGSNNEDGGVLGWVNKEETELEKTLGVYTSEYHKQLFTEDTYNKLFSFDEGEVSGVLKSSAGYHIFKVIKHNGAKRLGLADKVYPEATGTVYDFCKSYLAEAYQNATLNACCAKLIDSLRAEAKITVY